MSLRRFILIPILVLLCSSGVKADDFVYAYCPLGEGYVFLYDTVTGFQVLANLRCGEKVTVVDTQDKERTKVRTAAGKEGYVFNYTITRVFGVLPESATLSNTSNEPSRPAPKELPNGQPQPRPPSQSQAAPGPRPLAPRTAEATPLPVTRRGAEFELFGGYRYMRANIVVSGAPLNASGAGASMVMYLKDWLGIVGDFGLYRQNNVAAQGFNLVFSTYQFGPRLRFPNLTRTTPFVHFLWGAGHAGGTLYTRSLGFGVPPLGPNYAFVLTAGGGADWRVTSRLSIRMIEAEYMHSEFRNFSGNRQESISLSSGVVFTFGRE